MSSEFQPWQIAATIQLFGFGMTQTECFTNVVKGKLLRARTLSEEFLVCSSNTGNPSVENHHRLTALSDVTSVENILLWLNPVQNANSALLLIYVWQKHYMIIIHHVCQQQYIHP